MVFKKLAIIIGSTIATGAAVAGTGVAIAHAVQQNQSQSDGMQNSVVSPTPVKPGDKPDKNPTENNTGEMNDDKRNDELGDDPDITPPTGKPEKELSAEEIAKSLKPADITIRPYKEKSVGKLVLDKESKLEHKDVFAFLVKQEQFEVTSSKPNVDKVTFKVELDTAKNTIEALNKGNLSVKVTVTENKEESHKSYVSESIQLTEFKQPSGDLVKLLSTDDKYSITLPRSEEEKTKFSISTIDDLNNESMVKPPMKKGGEQPTEQKVSGLTNLLWKHKFGDDTYVGDIKIEGKAKVSSFVKDADNGDETNFVLTSLDPNKPLMLVKTSDDKKITDAILVGEIKTTNLLATDVTVRPLNNEAKVNEEFINEIKEAEAGIDKKDYSEVEEVNNLERTLIVNLASKGMTNNLFVKPYTVKKGTNFATDKNIPFEIIVSFGSGNDATRFSTSKDEDRKLLEECGFSFDVYSKHLTGKNDKVVSGTDVKGAIPKLTELFFKEENYTKFVTKANKATVNAEDGKNTHDGFFITEIKKEQFSNPAFNANDSRESENLIDADNNLPANFLVFANYTYKSKNIKDSEVSFTSVVSLIHLLNE